MKKFSSLKSLFVCTLLFSAVVTGCSSKTGNADAKSKNTTEKKIVVYSAGPKGLAEKFKRLSKENWYKGGNVSRDNW